MKHNWQFPPETMYVTNAGRLLYLGYVDIKTVALYEVVGSFYRLIAKGEL